MLITVKNTDGSSVALQLEPTLDLAQIRQQLTEQGYMEATDYFLVGDTELEKSQEEGTLLSELLGDGKILNIGTPTDESPIAIEDGVQRYNQLNSDEQAAIFDNIQIYRGLTLTQDEGFAKTFKDLFTWRELPAANTPRVITRVESHYSFSKVTHDMTVYSTDKASVSLSTPFASGEAEYEHEKSVETSTSLVKEYMIAKFMVRKGLFKVERTNLVVESQFVQAVNNAVQDHDEEVRGCVDLIKVLNTWGYYVPWEFVLGGALYATEQTSISEYSQAESEKQAFGGSFKAQFKGIGGGASYNHAEGSSTTTTQTDKYQDLSFLQIGGDPLVSSTDGFSNWAETLNHAVAWDVIEFSKLLPSIALLDDVQTRNTCVKLMTRYGSYREVLQNQPYIDLGGYARVVGGIFDPWA